jgi:hypothetical protein
VQQRGNLLHEQGVVETQLAASLATEHKLYRTAAPTAVANRSISDGSRLHSPAPQ